MGAIFKLLVIIGVYFFIVFEWEECLTLTRLSELQKKFEIDAIDLAEVCLELTVKRVILTVVEDLMVSYFTFGQNR